MNGRKESWLSRKAVIVAAATMSLVIALNGLIGYRDIQAIVSNFDEARKDGNTRIDLDSLLTDLLNAETGAHGFLLTGDVRALAPYRAALQRIPIDLQHIEQLTAGETEQRTRLALLRSLVGQRLAEIRLTLDTYQTSGARAALELAGAGPGMRLMESIRRTVATMTAEEERQRGEARMKTDASARRAFKVVVISTVVAAVLLLLTFLQFALAARVEQMARARAESAWEAETRARQDSDDTNRVKDQFIATVSHELRTPLTSILGWTAVLIDEDLSSPVVREGLLTIQRSASVQKRLIEDLLDASRILTGKLSLSPRLLELSELVHGAVESMRPAADAKSITVTAHLERGIRISGDPDRLQQVVWNLITNAVKFTPRGGAIDVDVHRQRADSIIEVRDSGEGIDESFLPHVFEAFRQSDVSRARVHKGLGLGLSIAKYLTEAHGGTISVWSAGKGQGTTFRVALPVVLSVPSESTPIELVQAVSAASFPARGR
jgi:signal transduction histidine kinase